MGLDPMVPGHSPHPPQHTSEVQVVEYTALDNFYAVHICLKRSTETDPACATEAQWNVRTMGEKGGHSSRFWCDEHLPDEFRAAASATKPERMREVYDKMRGNE